MTPTLCLKYNNAATKGLTTAAQGLTPIRYAELPPTWGGTLDAKNAHLGGNPHAPNRPTRG